MRQWKNDELWENWWQNQWCLQAAEMCMDFSILDNLSTLQAWAGLHFNILTQKALQYQGKSFMIFLQFLKPFLQILFNEFSTWPKWLSPLLNFSNLWGTITCYCWIDQNGTVCEWAQTLYCHELLTRGLRSTNCGHGSHGIRVPPSYHIRKFHTIWLEMAFSARSKVHEFSNHWKLPCFSNHSSLLFTDSTCCPY